jgi:hypothetical protein
VIKTLKRNDFPWFYITWPKVAIQYTLHT